MRKTYAVMLSLSLIILGSWLIALGILRGAFNHEGFRSILSLTLIGGFALVLVLGLLFSRLAARDYRAVFTTAMLLMSLGLFLLGVFFAFIDILVSPRVYGILLMVFLACYGLMMIMNGVANYFLSQQVYRVYIFDFLRSLPHAYYRYRT